MSLERLDREGDVASLEQGNDTASAATKWDELSSLPAFEEPRPLSYAEKVVQDMEDNLDKIVARNQKLVDNTRAGIEKIEAKIAAESDAWRVERYEQQIRDRQRVLRTQEAYVEFARVPTVDDVEYRTAMKKDFAKLVKEAVPDELPLVFHGSNNIGQVRQIIRTHGLKTPEQRGESMTSFASQIDVTAKTNIQTSCDFAESNYAWMPYGAIFAFLPKPEEEEEVRRTGDSTEVFGGVDGVDFKEETERLYGIITTPENIDQMRKWCKESGLDDSKVLTHLEFLESMWKLREAGQGQA